MNNNFVGKIIFSAACNCNGTCLKTGTCPSVHTSGNLNSSPTYKLTPGSLTMCCCDCHKPWGSVTPPVCVCNCNKISQTPSAPSLTPHKCPVCDGEGQRLLKSPYDQQFGANYKKCSACNGKGVLWG